MVAVRRAEPEDLPSLALLWHAGWQEAHAAHVPETLTRLRTEADFLRRLQDMNGRLRVAGPLGAPLGLCATKPGEIDQLYVSPAARGGGVATELLTDGEKRIREAGFSEAHLLVLRENGRAQGFYRKHGWRHVEDRQEALETSEGPFELLVTVMAKALSTGAASV